METKWVKRWDSWIAPASVKPGVFRRKEGGFLVRGRITDPRTGKMKEIRLNLVGMDALGAYNRLQDELGRVREGRKPAAPAQRMRFTEYAASLFEHKLKTGRIKSGKSREKWEYVIRLHLAPEPHREALTNWEATAEAYANPALASDLQWPLPGSGFAPSVTTGSRHTILSPPLAARAGGSDRRGDRAHRQPN
jgi:hypothetical protein